MKSFLKFALFVASAIIATAQAAVEPPVPVRTVAPEFPTEMRAQRVSGVVTVSVQIDESGNVTDSSVEKSSNPAFDPAAVAAVRKWKFKPAKKDGAAVAIRVSIPVKFNFEG
ncbi:MAG TPA: energy transducer TonB [Opitutaceae bacterium]